MDLRIFTFDFTRITLIGHSIGCRMLIDIVSRNTTHNFESRRLSMKNIFLRNLTEVYFLFPTIENMMSSPRGVPTWSLCTTWRRPMLLLLLTVLNLILPDFLLRLFERFPLSSYNIFLRRWILSVSMPQAPEVFVRAAARWRNPN